MGTVFSSGGSHYKGKDLGSQFSRNATLSTTSITILKLLDGKLKMPGKDKANGEKDEGPREYPNGTPEPQEGQRWLQWMGTSRTLADS